MLPFRHPAAVIDSVIADLNYLTEFLIDEAEQIGADPGQPSLPAVKAIAALEAMRMLLPRLRIVRSSFVADARLPDGNAADSLLRTDDACETSAAQRHPGVVR
jgi:hypothetical protein